MQRELLGPSGRPVTHDHRKVPVPVEGEKLVPRWATQDKAMYELPGGGALQFDLSKLELSDYRAMRTHYQLNISLALLSFMIHQVPFRVDGPETPARIRDFVNDQLHDLWPQLVRSISPAHWAGFAGSILQWENDGPSGRVHLTKIKDLEPEDTTINWSEVDGWARPGEIPPKIRVFDGLKVAGHNSAVPPENCVHPDTMILKSDCTWVRAGDLEVGTELVGFDEPDGARCYQKSVVEAVASTSSPSLTISTDIGVPVTVTHGHPLLVRRQIRADGTRACAPRWTWIEAKDVVVGDEVSYFGQPWEQIESRDAGWLAGMFDGEGSIYRTELKVAQRVGPILDQLRRLLDEHAFSYREPTKLSGENEDVCQLSLHGGVPGTMEFMGKISPTRLLRKFDNNWVGKRLSWKGGGLKCATVVEVEDVGTQPIINIQTSTRTYIANGYLSHNCFFYPLLMEAGNHNGRKLLKPAFAPWYFSQIMHLYQNRYFQRFGEPVPIARGDFNAQFQYEDGSTLNGREVMQAAVTNLQSGAAVILPNDRVYEPGTGNTSGEWAYVLDYVESQMRGADFDRVLNRLDEEMSLGVFAPTLLFRSSDVGSYNLGEAHMQVFLWMTSSLTADLGHYIDKYIIRRMVDFNFGPNAGKDLRFAPRQLGQETQATLRSIAQGMIQGGQAKVEAEDLSLALGMRFVETSPPDASPSSSSGSVPDGGDGIRPGTTSPEMSLPA